MNAKEQVFPGATGRYADEQLTAVVNDGIPTITEDPKDITEREENPDVVYNPKNTSVVEAEPEIIDQDGSKTKTLLYIGGALLIGALLFRK